LIGTQWSAFAVCSVHMNLDKSMSIWIDKWKERSRSILVVRKVRVRKVELDWEMTRVS